MLDKEVAVIRIILSHGIPPTPTSLCNRCCQHASAHGPPDSFAILRHARSWFLPLPNVSTLVSVGGSGGGVLPRKRLGNLGGPGTLLYQQQTSVGATQPHGLGKVGQKHPFVGGGKGTSALPYALIPPW